MVDLKLKNNKSVSFIVENFNVDIKKKRAKKHTIYGERNVGFNAEFEEINGAVGLVSSGLNADMASTTSIAYFHTEPFGATTDALLIKTNESANSGIRQNLYGELTSSAQELPNFKVSAFGRSNDRDYIFLGDEHGFWCADAGLIFGAVDTDCDPISLAISGNRLFALDEDGARLFYSAPFELDNFSGESAGVMKFNDGLGKILRILGDKNRIILVREFGLSSLETAFDAKEFLHKTLCALPSDVNENSIQIVGEKIFVLCGKALYGLKKGILERLHIEIEPENVKSAALGSKYFLSAGDKIFIIDGITESVIELEIEAQELFVFKKLDEWKIGVLRTGADKIEIIETLGEGTSETENVWESDWFKLSYATTNQYLKQVHIKTSADIAIEILSNKTARQYAVSGSGEVRELRFNLKGEMFKIKIKSRSAGANISDLTAVIGFNNN
ncbi:MAG: hypothetical protein LBM01_00965 [Christensenellaceae bacterium]|jgi:hypothetical protein|nr:hypothetical protein [Christensenellaceae bacterium]